MFLYKEGNVLRALDQVLDMDPHLDKIPKKSTELIPFLKPGKQRSHIHFIVLIL